MYTTCSLTVTVSSSWLSATVVKPEKPTQKSIVKKRKGFSWLFLFNDSSWITYYGCPIRNIFDNNRTSADEGICSDFFNSSHYGGCNAAKYFFFKVDRCSYI